MFKVTPSGVLTILYTFTGGNDGQYPMGELVEDPADGNFYGVTREGGTAGYGTVYRITPGGTLTTIYSFPDWHSVNDIGDQPGAGLTLSSDGSLYGTTNGGGLNDYGDVYKIAHPTTTPSASNVYTFTGGLNGGGTSTPLLLARDGNFYGTTGIGTIFKLTPAGTLTNLHTLTNTEGHTPSGLIQGIGSDSNFYGMTDVTLFKISPSGAFAILHNFSLFDNPNGALTFGSDGKLYGTTQPSNTNLGSVFTISTSGTNLVTLIDFYGAPAEYPTGEIVHATDGKMYGTTMLGGSGSNAGVVYQLSYAPPDPPSTVTATAGNACVMVRWTRVTGATGYRIYRTSLGGSAGTETRLAGVSGNATDFVDRHVDNYNVYYYYVSAIDAGGESIPSVEVSARPIVPTATFLSTDTTTHGSWKGIYGTSGWNVIGDRNSNNPTDPDFTRVTPISNKFGLWTSSSTAANCLQTTALGSPNRLAGVWYNTTFSVNINSLSMRQVAFYFLDIANTGYAETITVTDTSTGAVLDTQSVANFSAGVYKVWNVRGNVTFTLNATGQHWAVLSGIFFS